MTREVIFMEKQVQHTENTREVLAGFDGVWKRVSGRMPPPPPPPPPPKEDCPTLTRLIEDAGRIAVFDRALAAKSRGRARALLLDRAGQCRRAARRLSAELFLRCGERPRPEPAPKLPGDPMSALRASIQADEASALSFEAAAERERDGELAAFLRDFAARSRASAAGKRNLLLRSYR